MKKEEIATRYKKLVDGIEDAKIYDGRGEYNGYVCEQCGYITATKYDDKGVTPFVIRCRKCGGMASHKITSLKEPPKQQNISEVKHWIRPSLEQLLTMPDNVIEHVLDGGLILDENIDKL